VVGLPHCSAETLSALLDGELVADERAQARAHLDSCLDCSARLVAARRLDTDLRDAGRLSCASILPTLSALADQEATAGERALAGAHLADCPDCRLATAGLRSADLLLAALPASAPSARVDAFIAELARPRVRAAFRPATFAMRSAGAVALAVLIAIGSTIFQMGEPSADQVARSTEVAMVAAIQRVVFDSRTNTLYLLDADRAEVSAVDATTHTESARVSVGGTPTALALSISTNRVLVLDATSKRLTEIDTTSRAIVATATLVVTGTPTSLQVDPVNGRIVVASVSAPAANAAPAASAAGATGHVTVLDPVSKQVESVRAVDVAPQLVVLDAKGAQALLLSARETTLVDAASYKLLAQLPGGVAAAFDVSSTQVAVLSTDGASSKVTFRGTGLPASLSLPGRPIALIAMPGGGFAALVDRGAGGEIDVIDGTGHVVSSSAVALAGHSVTYDPTAARFVVGGDVGAGLAFSGASQVAVNVPPASAPPSQTATTTPPAPQTSSSTPVASGPTTPAAVAPVNAAVPPAARPSTNGDYRLAMADNRRPVLVAGSGRMLWFVDEAKRLASIDTTSGLVDAVAQLPIDGTFTRLLVGTSHVYAIDQGKGRLAILTVASGRLESIGFPFVSTAAGFSVGTDDRIWMAGGDSSNVLTFDPDAQAAKRVSAIDFRTASITALHVDSAARVWFADDASGSIGYYDQSRQTIVTVPAPGHGTVTALAMDRNGTLWAGTATGQLFSVRLGVVTAAGAAGGPVGDLVRDASGGVWSYVVAPGTVAYRSLTGGSGVRLAAVAAAAVAFDGLGRAWLAEPSGADFYIALNGDR